MKHLLIIIGSCALTFTSIAQDVKGNSYMYTDVHQVLDAAKVYRMYHNEHILSMFTDTAGLKITRANVAELVDYVYSQQKCRCIVSPFSSYMPGMNEYSTLGGIAMDMIEAYRDGTKYPKGGWSCTKTDRTRADELVHWWNREKVK